MVRLVDYLKEVQEQDGMKAVALECIDLGIIDAKSFSVAYDDEKEQTTVLCKIIIPDEVVDL